MITTIIIHLFLTAVAEGRGVDAATRRGAGGARRVAARGEEPELPIS